MREAFKKNITNIINKRRLSLRYSITENQEENNRSMNDSKLGKNIMTDNNSNKNFLINPKDGKETTISKKSNKQKFLKKISSKSFHKSNWDKDSSTEENNKKYLKYQSIKRRISEQQNRKENLIIKKFQIHDQKKDLSLSNKKKKVYFQMSNQNNIKNTKKSQKFLGFKNKLFTYFRKSSMTNKIILRNKSFNLSCTGSSIVQFHSTKTIRKDSFFGNRRINMNGEDDKILQINLFEKLKNNPMFEKSEKIIKKEKILYGLLALCTLLNIFFQILEAIQYNKKSLIYLENYASNNTVPNKPKKKRPKFYEKEILYYNIIQKREISSEENTLRIFNIIFSIMCIILVLNIYYIKNQYVKQANKNKKNFFRYNCNQFRFNKRIKDHDHIRITSINDDFIPTKIGLAFFDKIRTLGTYISKIYMYHSFFGFTISIVILIYLIAKSLVKRTALVLTEKLAFVLCVSGVINAISLVVVAPAADYRYMIWTVCAAFLSCFVLISKKITEN